MKELNHLIPIFPIVDIQKQPPRDVLRMGVLKTCSKFTEEQPCRNAISIKLHAKV